MGFLFKSKKSEKNYTKTEKETFAFLKASTSSKNTFGEIIIVLTDNRYLMAE